MNWTISRSRARDGKGWHIQARTDDQMNSFAAVVYRGANILRTKATDGKSDIFTMSQVEPHVTFNVLGKIRYVQDWETAL